MTDLQLNPGFGEELRRSTAHLDMLERLAEQVAASAQAAAPRATGAYADSIHVERRPDGVSVVAGDWKSGFIEFGTINNPAYAPLRAGAEQNGLQVDVQRGSR